MSKIKKIIIASAVIGSVGIAFAISSLKGISDSFDWDGDDE